MFKPKVFRSKCTVLKKVLETLLRLFGALPVIRRPESCSPCPPRYALFVHPGKLSLRSPVSVSAELNHNHILGVLDSDEGACYRHYSIICVNWIDIHYRVDEVSLLEGA